MSCLDMQEAPGRQAVGSVQAGRPEAGQAVCVPVSYTHLTLPTKA